MSVTCAYPEISQFSSVLCTAFLFFSIGAGGLHAIAVAAVALVVKEGVSEQRSSSFAGSSQAGIYMIARYKGGIYSIVESTRRLSSFGDPL